MAYRDDTSKNGYGYFLVIIFKSLWYHLIPSVSVTLPFVILAAYFTLLAR